MKERIRKHGLTTAQVFPWRGTVHVLKRTRATATWLEALDRAGFATPPSNVAIVLTGKSRKRLDDIGEAQMGSEGRARFVTIFLHDWPAGAFEDVYELLTRRLKRLFPAAAKRDTFVAYLAHVALHEIGHARHQLRGGSDISEERAETKAEDYAWPAMERLFARETLFRAFSVFCAASLDR